jgi:hypothetical protein
LQERAKSDHSLISAPKSHGPAPTQIGMILQQ